MAVATDACTEGPSSRCCSNQWMHEDTDIVVSPTAQYNPCVACELLSIYPWESISEDLKRVPIRVLPSAQALTVYSHEENTGEELLSRVCMGRYRPDGYVWHTLIKVRERLVACVRCNVTRRSMYTYFVVKSPEGSPFFHSSCIWCIFVFFNVVLCLPLLPPASCLLPLLSSCCFGMFDSFFCSVFWLA